MAIGKLPLPPSITKDEDKLAGRIEKPLRRNAAPFQVVVKCQGRCSKLSPLSSDYYSHLDETWIIFHSLY